MISHGKGVAQCRLRRDIKYYGFAIYRGIHVKDVKEMRSVDAKLEKPRRKGTTQ